VEVGTIDGEVGWEEHTPDALGGPVADRSLSVPSISRVVRGRLAWWSPRERARTRADAV